MTPSKRTLLDLQSLGIRSTGRFTQDLLRQELSSARERLAAFGPQAECKVLNDPVFSFFFCQKHLLCRIGNSITTCGKHRADGMRRHGSTCQQEDPDDATIRSQSAVCNRCPKSSGTAARLSKQAHARATCESEHRALTSNRRRH